MSTAVFGSATTRSLSWRLRSAWVELRVQTRFVENNCGGSHEVSLHTRRGGSRRESKARLRSTDTSSLAVLDCLSSSGWAQRSSREQVRCALCTQRSAREGSRKSSASHARARVSTSRSVRAETNRAAHLIIHALQRNRAPVPKPILERGIHASSSFSTSWCHTTSSTTPSWCASETRVGKSKVASSGLYVRSTVRTRGGYVVLVPKQGDDDEAKGRNGRALAPLVARRGGTPSE